VRIFLGGDLGGTKSHLLLADEAGRVLGFAAGGGANHEAVGYGAVTEVVRSLFREVLASAGIGATRVTAAGFGIAGLDWGSEEPAQLAALRAAGVDGFPVTVVNDAVVGLLAGATEGWGIGLVSGTGCNCWGLDRDGRLGRVLGMGARVGEFAGASALVTRAVWAISRAATRRGPETALTDAFLTAFRAADALAFLEGYCEERYPVDASLAPLVFSVAEAGDRVATECIAWAGRELADLVTGVARQLDLTGSSFELVLIGSLFRGGPLLLDPLLAAVRAEAPGARTVTLSGPPVIGGVVLAMRRAGIDRRDIDRQRLAGSIQTDRSPVLAPRPHELEEVYS